MSTPKDIFLDTQVFDSLNYNFNAKTLLSFLEVCKKKDLTMLLPAPTRDEIIRHMFERAKEAEGALERVHSDIFRKASFLKEWPRYPTVPRDSAYLRELTLKKVSMKAWEAFCKQLKVKNLDYDDIKLQSIMGWYNNNHAPFGKGDKRKEFPDAFAIAILDEHSRKSTHPIAVVSEDGDMRNACDRFQNLLHFPTLSSFVEIALSEDERVDLYINLINADIGSLNDALTDVAGDWCSFHHNDRHYRLERSTVHHATIEHFDIIGLGNHECTIAFEGSVEATHELSWEGEYSAWDEESYYSSSAYRNQGEVTEEHQIGGVAKIKFTDKDTEVVSSDNFELEDQDFYVDTSPRRW